MLLTLFILSFRVVVVAKLVMLGIWFLTSFILALKVMLVAKLVISGIFSSIFLIWALYTSFLITFFLTALLSLFKTTGTGSELSTYYSSTFLFKLFPLAGSFFNLSKSSFSTLYLKWAKSFF